MARISLCLCKTYYIWRWHTLNIFSVSSVRALDSIRDFVHKEIDKWLKIGVKVNVREYPANDCLILYCRPVNAVYVNSYGWVQRVIKSSLADGLSEIIVNEYEQFLVVKLIDTNYGYLSERNRKTLKRKALQALNNDGPSIYKGKLGNSLRSQRKKEVWAKLADYLEQENRIIIEGFITFRLKEYLEKIFAFVEDTVKEHLTNREDGEFLDMLRHFMQQQKHSEILINVYRVSDNQYEILNSMLEPIEENFNAYSTLDTNSSGLDIDDIVVSAIITLAPKRIIWHGNTENSACFDLLHDLFQNNIEVCTDCDLKDDP